MPTTLQWVTAELPDASATASPTLSSRVWFSLLWGHCSLLLGPEACKILCVSSKSGGNVHTGLVEVLQSNPAGLQSQIPGGSLVSLSLSLSLCWIPKLKSLTWGSELSQEWEHFCAIIVLQFAGCPPTGYEIWLYHDCTPPPTLLWLLLCLWMRSIFFGGFKHLWYFSS